MPPLVVFKMFPNNPIAIPEESLAKDTSCKLSSPLEGSG